MIMNDVGIVDKRSKRKLYRMLTNCMFYEFLFIVFGWEVIGFKKIANIINSKFEKILNIVQILNIWNISNSKFETFEILKI